MRWLVLRSMAAIFFVAPVLVFADAPQSCSDSGSSLNACYPAEGSGSLSVLFPHSTDDLKKLFAFVKTVPDTTAKLDTLLATFERIDRVLHDTELSSEIRTGLVRSSSVIKRILAQYAEQIRAKRKFDGEVFDTSDRYNHLVIQSMPLSCEIAAVSTILSSMLKTDVSEEALFPILPKSFADVSPDEFGLWGNPNSGFVGDIHGSQRRITGYGVYEAPIKSVYTAYGVKTQSLDEAPYSSGALTPDRRLSLLLWQLQNGNYVQLWGDYCTDPAVDDGIVSFVTDFEANNLGITAKNACSTWDKERAINWWTVGKNLEKIPVSGTNGEHAFVLLGYVGTMENPSHIIVWDTDSGKHFYPISEWMRKWKKLGYKGIVVEKKEK